MEETVRALGDIGIRGLTAEAIVMLPRPDRECLQLPSGASWRPPESPQGRQMALNNRAVRDAWQSTTSLPELAFSDGFIGYWPGQTAWRTWSASPARLHPSTP